MKRRLKVFKFGGASLKDAEALRNVAQILRKQQDGPLLVVVSAMGKTTNALEEVVAAHYRENEEAIFLLHQLRDRHLEVARSLFAGQAQVSETLCQTFREAEQWLHRKPEEVEYDYLYDQVVSVGELASSQLAAAYLNEVDISTRWLDARAVIRTDAIYREGWVQWEKTQEQYDTLVRPMLEEPGLILTQGFLGSTTDNQTTTLGREGSDYSAAIFSFCADAESMTIWKDVPGVLTADPRLFENVIKLDRLSYREAIEMTYYGAKVIHPKTIKPLQNKSIPLYVKSFIEPEGEGTYISDEVEDNYPSMVAVEHHQALLQISTRDFSFVAEHHMSYLFKLIADLRLQVNMMQNSAISFSVVLNDVDDRVDRFTELIEKEFKVVADRGLELITVRHFRQEVLDSLRRGKIVLLEERIRNTAQLVVKDVPMMVRKSKWPNGKAPG